MTGQVLEAPKVKWTTLGAGAQEKHTAIVNGRRLTVKPALTKGEEVWCWSGLIDRDVEVKITDELEHCMRRLITAAEGMAEDDL